MSQQVWFITGSSRGLGRALVVAALEAGDRVVATARRPETLAAVREKYGDRVHPLALDVTRPEAARRAVEAAVGRYGRIDVLVNNAGYANVSPIETADDDDVRAQFETNFWGATAVAREAVRFFREVNPKGAGGRLLNFSSVSGLQGMGGFAHYCASKFGGSQSVRFTRRPWLNAHDIL